MRVINEADASSSACHFRRIYQVETSTPPSKRPHSRLTQSIGQARVRAVVAADV